MAAIFGGRSRNGLVLFSSNGRIIIRLPWESSGSPWAEKLVANVVASVSVVSSAILDNGVVVVAMGLL